MTDPQHSPSPQAIYKHRTRFSFVWLVPLLALLVVSWTAWSSWYNKGPVITITFNKVEGIELHRTQIKHKGVTLGTIIGMEPAKDFRHVVVKAQMGRIAKPFLTSGTKFWIVHPRVSVGSISDLNTLVSGIYIELAPDSGEPTHEFTGLEEPLAVDRQEPGRNYTLQASQLGSLERGSPLYFHGMQVGQVTNFNMAEDRTVQVHIFIRDPYADLVTEQTHFWNVSGFGITAGSEGFRISAQSLQAVVQGGVAFDVPEAIGPGKIAPDGANFALYPDLDSANNSIYTQKINYILRFAGSIQGLTAGSAVDLQGNVIGRVAQTQIRVDAETGSAVSEVVLEIQPGRIDFAHGPSTPDRARAAFEQMVKHNLRAKLANGNLLTGQKTINLQFIADAEPAVIKPGDPYPEFPTASSDDIDTVLHNARNLLKDADTFVRTTGPEVAPLLQSLKTTSDQINTNDGSGGLTGTLDEVKQAARSMKELADYLDAHPESILRGKEEK